MEILFAVTDREIDAAFAELRQTRMTSSVSGVAS
jgi:hypothetical protein